HRPDLLGRQLLRHHRHDRLIALHDVSAGLVERFVQVLLAALSGLALAAAAPIGPWPFSSVKRLGARVPRPWHVGQPPIPVNTFSPAATSCSGVTFAPRVSVCGTSDCTCGISLAMRV